MPTIQNSYIELHLLCLSHSSLESHSTRSYSISSQSFCFLATQVLSDVNSNVWHDLPPVYFEYVHCRLNGTQLIIIHLQFP